MRILGLDPGPSWTGFAVLSDERVNRPIMRYHEAGKVASTITEVAGLLRRLVAADIPISAVAIEQPDGIHTRDIKRARAIGKATQGTAHAAGLFAGMAAALILAVVEVRAGDVRRRLCGKRRGTAGDAAVKAAIGIYVVGWPKTLSPAGTIVHARDAAAVALVSYDEARGLLSRNTGT